MDDVSGDEEEEVVQALHLTEVGIRVSEGGKSLVVD